MERFPLVEVRLYNHSSLKMSSTDHHLVAKNFYIYSFAMPINQSLASEI